MKAVSIIGTRPQFVKAAPVLRGLASRKGHRSLIVHTGQHYDEKMSDVFFQEMGIPAPDVNLEVGSGTHAFQIGTMLIKTEEILAREKPDWVVVYGDTNSTLAGTLAALKAGIPVAHVEAGLRSHNWTMPEEQNRVLTDHASELLLCPTELAIRNLAKEGITKGVHWVGDTMYDAVAAYSSQAEKSSAILDKLGLKPKGYLLATVHRPYNTDIPENLASILQAFGECGEQVLFPVHPRTRGCIERAQLPVGKNVRLVDPVGYLDMLMLEKNARAILTDSGGIQKEAYIFGVPCITMRPETEWIETVEAGWNVLVSCDRAKILQAIRKSDWPKSTPPLYGEGKASQKIIELLESSKGKSRR